MKMLIMPAAGQPNNPLTQQLGLPNDCLLPVNGKPVIGWSIEHALKHGVDEIIVATNEASYPQISKYLALSFHGRKVSVIAIKSRSLGETIQKSLGNSTPDSLFILFADTIYLGEYAVNNYNYLSYRNDYTISERWCSVVTDSAGMITQFFDKKSDSKSDKIVSGFIFIKDVDKFKDIIEGGADLYPALSSMQVKAVLDNFTFDSGHLDNYYKTKKELLRTRSFNALKYDEQHQTLVKTSKDHEKLKNEINWYLALPQNLQIFAPRLVNYSLDNPQYTLEYYGYNSLQELYISNSMHSSIWKNIVNKILRTYESFERMTAEPVKEHIDKMYVQKTSERLNSIKNPLLLNLISQTTLEINGKKMKGYRAIESDIAKRVKDYGLQLKQFSVIHGDLCFSNILFDLNNQIIKMIDPRGEFGAAGIYGDSNYDLAKLRHSIVDYYDFIVSDLFQLKKLSENSFVYNYPAQYDELGQYFDSQISKKTNIDDIKLIEGLLFISMIPLHSDSEERQVMMYLTGVKLLNEVLGKQELGKQESQNNAQYNTNQVAKTIPAAKVISTEELAKAELMKYYDEHSEVLK